MLEGVAFWIVGTVMILGLTGSIYNILSNNEKPREPKYARPAGLISLFLVLGSIYYLFIV